MNQLSIEDYIKTARYEGPVNAADCVLREVRAGVWSCTEFKSGKIFMVRR